MTDLVLNIDEPLYGYRWEAAKPIAVVVLHHGMAETIERYAEFAEFLQHNNISVYGVNARGHGSHEKTLGFIGPKGFLGLVSDFEELVNLARGENLDLPLFIFGHSMGSFVARMALKEGRIKVQGAIFCGTGYADRLSLFMAKVMAAHVALKEGSLFVSEKINNMVFKKYNDKLVNPKTKYDWLTRDEVEVQKYIDDPLCGNTHTASFFWEFFQGIAHIQFKLKPDGITPVLFISGSADPVGLKAFKAFSRYNKLNPDAEIKIYDGARHELLKEINRIEVMEDILNWIKKRI